MITLEEKMLNLDNHTGSYTVHRDQYGNFTGYSLTCCNNKASEDNVKQTSIFGDNICNDFKRDGLFKSCIKKVINNIKNIKLL